MDHKPDETSSKLFDAVAKGDMENVKVILAKIDPNEKAKLISKIQVNDGVSLCSVNAAIRYNKPEIVKLLLEDISPTQRESIFASVHNGQSSFHLAAEHSTNSEVILTMLETLSDTQMMRLLSIPNNMSLTPLYIAARHNENSGIIKALLGRCSVDQRMTLLCMKDKDECTPSHYAATYKDTADVMIAMLETLDTEKIMTFLSMKNKDDWTPVHLAARYNKNADVMRAMLETLDTEQIMTLLCMKNKDDWTPVHLAARYNKNADIMRAMLETLDTEQRWTLLCMKNNDEYTPVLIAARYNENSDVMRAMLETLDTEKIMTLLCMKKKVDWTPVHLAARYNKNADIMRAMLETLDTEQRWTLLCMKNNDEYTPVLIAARCNENTDVMRAMLETLDTEKIMTLLCMKDSIEWTPVHSAARYNENADVMRAMLETLDTEQRMTLLSMQIKNEWTPVLLAARHNENADVMRAMLETLDTEQTMTLLSMQIKNEWTPVLLAARHNENADVRRAMLETLDSTFSILLLIAARTGDRATDCDIIGCLQSHGAFLQLESNLMNDLFNHMKDSDTAALSFMLDYLTTDRHVARKHHALLWVDKLDNNLLHLAASVSHTKFISKILCSQDNHEINQALQRKNADGLTPYYLASNPDTRRLLAWSQSQAGCYPLPNPPRVIVFYTSQNRQGADTEKDSFVRTLETLNILLQVIENPTEKEVYDMIRANQTWDISALIVVIMSHGNRGTVTVSDGDLPINKILLQMNPVMLEGIPKILILQACQGRPATGRMLDCETSGSGSNYPICQAVGAGLEKAAAITRTEPKTETDSDIVSSLDSKPEHGSDAQIKNTAQEPYTLTGPDMAVLSATVDKQTATRNLLIPILAKHLQKSDADEDLVDVFRKTTDELRSKEPAQVPECRTTMRYKICLHKVFRPETEYKPDAKE